MEIYCRVLKAEDSRAYRELRLESLKLHPECFGSGYTEQSKLPKLYFEDCLEQGSTKSAMLGAFIGNELVGLCGLTPSTSKKIEIIQMYVVKKNRGLGIAFKLLDLAKCYLKHFNSNSLILTVYQTNLSAIKVYQDAGFDVISSQNGEIQMAFVMRT
ncbi:GNAT family N-acetyltransferase [Moritella sp. 36]|uniref:GNAT family N-acetyltransferase n=1 Tax=Moritella sp. 36 TaxID=2746233 RepID=UPI001BA58902|nr:GNAT family N-acetyltransferase [Moritella sp. 36]QUM88956.1 GNAT family N-acetyltransferase [Moritella sp. 36]